ncbi:MAG: LysR family transcriptional regulator [Beijerinckiaceae bacterium]
MDRMNKIDHLGLDGHALRLFLAILEEGSITVAAARLGLTQSAVSHSLQRLRQILHDPLFVKAGRGIVATAHAQAMGEPARDLLRKMQEFSRGASFDPRHARLSLTIAANDLQRNLLLPALFRKLEASLEHVSLRIIPSLAPSLDVLRANDCDLLITPRPPAGSDVMQKRLLGDNYVCFFDAAMRKAPQKTQDYLGARHITVVYPDGSRLDFDKRLEAGGILRDIAVAVPSFTGVGEFLRGSTMLASLPGLLHRHVMREFAHVAIPLDAVPAGKIREMAKICELAMYMVWHRRYQNDPAQAWLRGLLETVANEIATPR